MIISPKIGMWLSISAAIIGGLLLCGTELTTLFGEAVEVKILAGLSLFNVLLNAANGVLHAIPASQPPSTAVANQFPLGPKA